MSSRETKILIQITSAGVDPWLSIEEQGQRATFAKEGFPGVEIVWVEGDPTLSTAPVFRLLNRIMRIYHAGFHSPLLKLDLRRNFFVRFVFWALNAVAGRRENELVMPVFYFADIRAKRARDWRKPGGPVLVTRFLRSIYGSLGAGVLHGSRGRFRLNFPNSYYLTPQRVLVGMRHAVENFEFDYLFKTVSTNYIELDRLMTAVSKLPTNQVYAGKPLNLAGTEFVSGAGQLFSRDVVERIISQADSLRLDVFDDVAIARLISDFSIAPITPLRQVDVQQLQNPTEVSSEEYRDDFNFRCKVGRVTTNSQDPISTMLEVHSLLDPCSRPSPISDSGLAPF